MHRALNDSSEAQWFSLPYNVYNLFKANMLLPSPPSQGHASTRQAAFQAVSLACTGKASQSDEKDVCSFYKHLLLFCHWAHCNMKSC
jgi:hypothetical protein